MPLSFLRDASVFGVASLGGLYIAIDLDENPITGTTSEEVAHAVCAVLGIDLPGMQLEDWDWSAADDIARKRGQQLLKSLNGTREFEVFLCYLSGFVHEARHFHDLLSCSIGQELFFQSLNLYQNAPVLLAIITDQVESKRLKRIPLPIDGHKKYSSEILCGALHEDEAVFLIKKYHEVEERVKRNWDLEKPTLTGASLGTLFELSAVCAQFGFVYDVFGQEGANTLLRVLTRSRAGRHYLEGIRFVEELFASNLHEEVAELNISAYLTWHSLQGRKPIGKRFEDVPSPVILWEYLIERLSRKGTKRASWQELDVFIDESTSAWNLLPLSESITDWRNELDKRLTLFKGRSEESDTEHPAALLGLAAFEASLSSRDALLSRIFEEPNIYHDLQCYGWSVIAGFFPAPSLALKFHDEELFMKFHGAPVVGEDLGRQLMFWETVLDLLLKGRGSGAITFIEDHVFESLIKGKYGGPQLDFWLNR